MFRRKKANRGERRPLFETSLGPVWAESVKGADAWDAWQARRTEGDGWPLILGDDDSVGHLLDLAPPEGEPVERIIEASARVDVDALLASRREDDEDEAADVVGEWPDDVVPSRRLQVPYSYSTGRPVEHLTLATLPISQGWQSAAVLGWGGWNECPMPAEHVALHRSWADRYGAEVVCMTLDIVEMHVARPPATREAAMALAHEQFAYCSDIVLQGTESVSALAAELLDSPFWFFWWD